MNPRFVLSFGHIRGKRTQNGNLSIRAPLPAWPTPRARPDAAAAAKDWKEEKSSGKKSNGGHGADVKNWVRRQPTGGHPPHPDANRLTGEKFGGDNEKDGTHTSVLKGLTNRVRGRYPRLENLVVNAVIGGGGPVTIDFRAVHRDQESPPSRCGNQAI